MKRKNPYGHLGEKNKEHMTQYFMPEENEDRYLKYLRKESVSQGFYIQQKWLKYKGTLYYQQESKTGNIILMSTFQGIC